MSKNGTYLRSLHDYVKTSIISYIVEIFFNKKHGLHCTSAYSRTFVYTSTGARCALKKTLYNTRGGTDLLAFF